MSATRRELTCGCEISRSSRSCSAQLLGLDRVLIMRNGNPAKAMAIVEATGVPEKGERQR